MPIRRIRDHSERRTFVFVRKAKFSEAGIDRQREWTRQSGSTQVGEYEDNEVNARHGVRPGASGRDGLGDQGRRYARPRPSPPRDPDVKATIDPGWK